MKKKTFETRDLQIILSEQQFNDRFINVFRASTEKKDHNKNTYAF